MNFPKRSGVEGMDKQGGVNYRSVEAFEKQHPTCHSRNHLKGSKKGKKVSRYRLSTEPKIYFKLICLFLAGGVDYKGNAQVVQGMGRGGGGGGGIPDSKAHNLGIHEKTFPGFPNPQAEISIPESGFPYLGRGRSNDLVAITSATKRT